MKFFVNPASALCATKNLSVLLIIGLAVLSGCRDTHQIEPQDTNFNLTTPHVENGYLVFDDYKAFLRLLKSPENVSTILVEN